MEQEGVSLYISAVFKGRTYERFLEVSPESFAPLFPPAAVAEITLASMARSLGDEMRDSGQ